MLKIINKISYVVLLSILLSGCYSTKGGNKKVSNSKFQDLIIGQTTINDTNKILGKATGDKVYNANEIIDQIEKMETISLSTDYLPNG